MDDQSNYLGIINLNDLLNNFANLKEEKIYFPSNPNETTNMNQTTTPEMKASTPDRKATAILSNRVTSSLVLSLFFIFSGCSGVQGSALQSCKYGIARPDPFMFLPPAADGLGLFAGSSQSWAIFFPE